jgi:class 3 adenylate cyclase
VAVFSPSSSSTYHRPVAEERIIMFLDLSDSTALAEKMGELRLHDLITYFFFDIDSQIVAHDGEVHAYVGDEVIVTWPLRDKKTNASCIRCFFAIEDAIRQRSKAYERRFGVAPRFRASLHTGTVVASECGNSKRQIAYFGDAMNVSSRLQEYCKMVGSSLVASGSLLQEVELSDDLQVDAPQPVRVRGRESPVEIAIARRKAVAA